MILKKLYARRSTITGHLKKVFLEGELDENSVCRKFRQTATNGKITKSDIVIPFNEEINKSRLSNCHVAQNVAQNVVQNVAQNVGKYVGRNVGKTLERKIIDLIKKQQTNYL